MFVMCVGFGAFGARAYYETAQIQPATYDAKWSCITPDDCMIRIHTPEGIKMYWVPVEVQKVIGFFKLA